MSDIIKDAKRLAELKVPPLRAEVTAHEDEDPRYTDDCLVQIIEKDDENSIWYEEEHGGYEHGKLHFAHVFAAAPELTETIADMGYEYACQRLLPGTPEDWYTWLTVCSLEIANMQIREHAERLRARGYEPQSYRIRRRLVGDWEVINE